MKIIAQTIRYDRKTLNNVVKKIKRNVDLVFDSRELAKNEEALIESYYSISNLNYTMFGKTFFEIIKNDKPRFSISARDALPLINKIINKLKLFDFWIINGKQIICIYHEGEICIINKYKTK